MDRFENGLSKEDNFDSWDIINNDCEDNSHDFEIIKVLREVEMPLIETETYDTIVLNNQNTVQNNNNNNNNNNNAFRKDTFTTDDSGETTDEDYEDIKKCKQGIKKERNNFVETHTNKLSTKKELKFKRKQILPDKTILKKKDENKNKIKKCNTKKSRPFFNSANLGALLTAFGLSLIFLNSSDKTQTCPTDQESKSISDTLVDAINDTKIWTDGAENMFDEEKLIERFLPANVNKTILERKNLKTKILKRIDRKIKQQIRGCDIKPLKKEKKTTKVNTIKTKTIGPLTKDDEFYANNSSSTSSKPISYRDAVLTNKKKDNESSISNKTTSENTTIIDFNVSKTKADMMNKFLDNDIKKFTETPQDLEILKLDADENCTETKYKVINYELKKKPNCSSIYKDFIKAEMLFKKILNNSYDIPKPKTPTDLAYNIENKINILTEDNINLSNIIEEQENLLRQIRDKIEYKKEILQKRSQQKNILQKRLKFANWMKQKREHDEQKIQKPNLGEKILNNIVTTNVQNNNKELNGNAVFNNTAYANNNKNNSKSTTEIATRYEIKYPLAINDEKYKNKTDEETTLYLKHKIYLLKKHEDLQRNMDKMKRKLTDEEHMKACKLPEKSDPKRAWTKKKTEF